MLYFESRLSRNGDISCNSCHALDRFGVDNQPTSPGDEGQRGSRSSPTVFNAALHIAQFWDGRAADVEEQALGPILNPVEMALPSGERAVEIIRAIDGYREPFRQAFPGDTEPISFENMGVAIGAFERRLITPSRLDRFMAGDLDALNDQELRGFQIFMTSGCIGCHSRPPVGGMSFQRLGVVEPYPTEDVGRAEVTGRDSDRFVFKVPSLRNVAKTFPYFHGGEVTSLDDAVRAMGRHQLGRSFTTAEIEDLITFLGSLTGELDASYIAAPRLP